MTAKILLSILMILSIFTVSCEEKPSSEEGGFVSRSSVFKIYCMEDFMADAIGWSINFNGEEVNTEGRLFSLSHLGNAYEIALETEQDFNLGLPYGRYNGVREEDSQKVTVVISGLDQVNTHDSGFNWYSGSTIVGNQTSDITCWNSRE